ncbi:MAG: FIVAR domain-containing protein, partial [Synergistaceae bacterium]|nr:FIVAR domain-containing protein [Synergistaceae bacterium]
LDGDKFLEQTAEEFADGTVLASLESGSGGADEWEQGTDHPVLKDIGAGDVAASSLAASIADAEAKLAAAVEGTAHGQYPAGSKDAFQNAIDGAKSVLSAPNPSQEDLEGAIADLSAAETAFEGAKSGTDGRGNENTLGGGGCNAAGVSALPLLALLGVVLRKKRWQKAD